jgi:MHS family proline/betaine transporter-like MFS transporter
MSTTRTGRRRLIGGAVGTFVEWYDFLVYGISAPVLAEHFFPRSNPTAALLGTLAIFGVAFVVRPLGGMFFGYLGDRRGRIKILSLTVLLMGGATMLLGLLPTYETIGIAAPILLVVCRLVQGFSTGGEHSGAMSFVLESAPEGRRARWIGIVWSASFLPVAVMAVMMLGLQQVLGRENYAAWGWRVPFLFGAVIAVAGLFIRLRLSDPEEFIEASRETPVRNPVRSAVTRDFRSLLIVLLLMAPSTISVYLLITYMYTFLVQTVRMDSTVALLSNATATLVVAIMVPFLSALADRVGRKPLMYAGTAWLVVAAYPAIRLVGTGDTAAVYAGQLLIGMGIALLSGGCIVTMLELFRTSVRYSGHAIAYNVGAAVFGGATPFIAGLLVSSAGPLSPAYYLAGAALVGLVVVKFTPETRGVDLRTAGAGDTTAAAGETRTRALETAED